MPVVKALHASAMRQSAIVMDLSDLERQAADLVANARKQAADIVAQARAEAQAQTAAIKEEARQAGHVEGHQAGFQEGHQAGHDEALVQTKQGLQDLVARWSNTLGQLQNNMPTHMADARIDLVRLSLAIAIRITHQEALENKAVVRSNVERALALVAAGRTVAIQVHPDELAVMEGYLPELVANFRTVAAIELQPDATLTPGGCILRFGAGQIDATLETQAQRIADELLSKQE